MSERVTLVAPAISCDHCAMAIRRELGEMAGVTVVDVDVTAKSVTLQVEDQAALSRARAALEEIGYPATPLV